MSTDGADGSAPRVPGDAIPLLDAEAVACLTEACGSFFQGEPESMQEAVAVAARHATARLVRRLSAALEEEALLTGARVWLEGGSLRVEAPGQEACLEDLGAVARFCCSCCDGASSFAEVVAAELRQAFLQECLCLLFRELVWVRESKLPASLLDASSDATQEQQLLYWEQFAAFAGHPTHVMAKARSPFSLAESIAYAPEFAPQVALLLVAVDADLLNVWPSPEAWQHLWEESFPEAASEAKGGHVLLPVHPLNREKLLEICGEDFKAGRMRFLDTEVSSMAISAVPTLSLRTLVPLDAFPGLRIKLPVPLVATSLPRYVSPVEVRGSILISQALKELKLPKELTIQLENFAVHLRFGESATYTYEQARYCSAIFRESPAVLGQPGCVLVPLGAMFGRAAENSPCVWHDFWRKHSISDGRTWFQNYASVVVSAQLQVFQLFGISLEAHQQNTTLEFEGGLLRRMICQELGGGIFWDPERLAHLPIDFRHKVYERDDVLVPFTKCLACLRHTMLRMHLLPLADEVSSGLGVPLASLRADLRQLIRSSLDGLKQDEADSLPASDFAGYAAAAVDGLLTPRGELKALLRMRLLQTKSEIYVEGGTGLEDGDGDTQR